MLILLVSCYGVIPISAWANSPFPYAPLHLQSEVKVTTAGNAKPNVLLYIDDSGSMDEGNSAGPGITRWGATKDSLHGLVSKYGSEMRWALYFMNRESFWPDRGGGMSFNATVPFSKTYHDQNQHVRVLDIIKKLPSRAGGGGTPSTRGFVKFADDILKAPLYRCQRSYIIFMSDGDANGGSTTSTVSEYYSNYPKYQKEITSSVPTDFTRDVDNTGNLPYYTAKLASQDMKTYAAHGNDAAGKSWDDKLFPLQTVETYTIGFGNDFTSFGKGFLERTASRKENFILAKDQKTLTDAFDKILVQIKEDNQIGSIEAYSVAAAATVSNNIEGMAAAATLNTGSWTSQLRFYQMDPNTKKVKTDSWLTPEFPKDRSVLVSYNGHYSLASNLSLDNDFFDMGDSQHIDEWKESLLPWFTRSKTDKDISAWANRQESYIEYRQRNDDDKQMGDIIDNPIINFGEINKANKRSQYLITSTNEGMMYIFENTNSDLNSKSAPYKLLFNYMPMSMQREGNSDTVANYYQNVASSDYGASTTQNQHLYLMNGGMAIKTTAPNKDGSKQSFLAANMGQGGRGMFVINLFGKSLKSGDEIGVSTQATQWSNTVPLFETAKGEQNNLGYTISTPQISRVSTQRINTQDLLKKNVRYAVFLANGYQAPTIKEETALYVYDGLGVDAGLENNASLHEAYKSGDLIRKISVPNSTKGLSTPLLVDVDFDGLVDIAYAGSYDGNLYRFDFRGQSPDAWTVHMLYQGSPDQPIVAAPAVARLDSDKDAKKRYIITFGTGTDFYQHDLTSTKEQNILGIYDDIDQNITVTGKSNLLEQTFSNKVVDGKSFRFLSNHTLSNDHQGWFIKLGLENSINNGERVVTAPQMIDKTVVFTTRIYDNVVTEGDGKPNSVKQTDSKDICISETKTIKSDAQSWVLAMNVINGGALRSKDARIDFTTNDIVVKSDDFFANGQRYLGLSNFTLILQNHSKSYTPDGAITNIGEDDLLGAKIKTKSNCLDGTNNNILINNTTGNFDLHNINQQCKSESLTLKRKSWRELHI